MLTYSDNLSVSKSTLAMVAGLSGHSQHHVNVLFSIVGDE